MSENGDSNPFNDDCDFRRRAILLEGNVVGFALFPQRSCPRRRLFKEWGDLVKDEIHVVTPNSKTSGGARWNFLEAWAWARVANGGDDAKARGYVARLFQQHVLVLNTDPWEAMTTFVQRGFGDVLLAWENEAYLSLEELGPDKFEIVTPSISIKAEPSVALVDGTVDAKGTRKAAQASLNFLYSDVGQRIVAKHYYRPYRREAADPEDIVRFAEVKLGTIDEIAEAKACVLAFVGDF